MTTYSHSTQQIYKISTNILSPRLNNHWLKTVHFNPFSD